MATEDLYLDAGVKGWIFNTARANYWRVASWYELEDLIQDGYLCFAKCRARFKTDRVDLPAEEMRTFMGYLERAFLNHITDLANKRTSTPESPVADLPEDKQLESWADRVAELPEGNLAVLLANAPTEIKEMLQQILVEGIANTPYVKTKLRKKFLSSGAMPRMIKGRNQLRETTSAHFDRCLGRSGVVEKLRSYFLSEPDENLV
jgi:hypothetical protein